MISILRLFFLAVATFLGGLLITFVSPLKLFSPTEKLSYQLAAGIAGVWADFMRWLLTTVKTEYVIQVTSSTRRAPISFWRIIKAGSTS